MASKILFLLVLAFAVVLLISSQIAAAKDLDAGKVEDVKYYYDLEPYCSYGCCGSSGSVGQCMCCSTLAEATAYKQAHEAQTHN